MREFSAATLIARHGTFPANEISNGPCSSALVALPIKTSCSGFLWLRLRRLCLRWCSRHLLASLSDELVSLQADGLDLLNEAGLLCKLSLLKLIQLIFFPKLANVAKFLLKALETLLCLIVNQQAQITRSSFQGLCALDCVRIFHLCACVFSWCCWSCGSNRRHILLPCLQSRNLTLQFGFRFHFLLRFGVQCFAFGSPLLQLIDLLQFLLDVFDPLFCVSRWCRGR
mmetsp:Transcript_102702/g.257477  ORF Transcript_102702/g.257477 Transcript_102702/m.257477 type:complete len:227 (+) Transcript_102702:994-1674(+)